MKERRAVLQHDTTSSHTTQIRVMRSTAESLTPARYSLVIVLGGWNDETGEAHYKILEPYSRVAKDSY